MPTSVRFFGFFGIFGFFGSFGIFGISQHEESQYQKKRDGVGTVPYMMFAIFDSACFIKFD